jgi:hypothetical protein
LIKDLAIDDRNERGFHICLLSSRSRLLALTLPDLL